MPDKTIYRGLMNAATQTPTDPGARLRALQQRMQARRQGMPQQPRRNPRAPGGYDGSGINPGANLPRAQVPAAMPGVPQKHLNQPLPGMPPRPGQGTTQNPGGIMPPHMQQQRPANSPVAMPPQAGTQMPRSGAPASVSTQAMPQRMPGMPAPGSGINPTVPGVTMPDAAKAPRMTTAAAPRPIGGLMAPMPYEQS